MVDDKPEDKPDGGGPSSGASSEAGATSRRPRTPPTIDLEASRIEKSEAAAQPSPDSTATDNQRTARSKRARTASLGIIVPAAAGAAAVVLIGGLAWFAGVLDTTHTLDAPTVAAIETLGARLARLEDAPKSSIARSEAALATRLDAMEQSIEKSFAALRDDLTAVRAKGDRTASVIEEIKAASQSSSPGSAILPDLSAIEGRLAQLETKIQALSAENTQLKAAQAAGLKAVSVNAAADDISLKRVLAATSLDLAVRQGEPFAAALAAARQLTDEAATLKPLEGFAASGVPGVAALNHDLLIVLPQLGTAPEGTSQGSGWLDRLRTSASRLVKIRRTDAAADNDITAPIARATVAARRNDLTEARRALNALPQTDRAKVQPWIDKVDARDAALAASRQFAANAMTALVKSAP